MIRNVCAKGSVPDITLVLLILQFEDPSDSILFSSILDNLNRRHGHGRRLLAAGTKATADLPDGTKVTVANLNTALAVFVSILACVFLICLFRNTTHLAHCETVLIFSVVISLSVFNNPFSTPPPKY